MTSARVISFGARNEGSAPEFLLGLALYLLGIPQRSTHCDPFLLVFNRVVENDPPSGAFSRGVALQRLPYDCHSFLPQSKKARATQRE